MTTVISAEGLGKKYLISHQPKERYTALRDVLAARARRLSKGILRPFSGAARAKAETQEEFWALRDVSFEIREGDRVGIIGRNGAGKSTLLKILSRITEPSTGRVKINGRVASLLEVGTGFHPELTGRENIFLNGAILGMTKAEIRRKFDEIVAFAEVEKFLDTPVKHYSSGMYVRLAFAVAAHLEPEILVIDEVLAVGDAQFQKKCLGRMEEAGKEGRTILFVSHNLAAVRALCNRAIVLKNGIVVTDCSVSDAVTKYLEDVAESVLSREWRDEGVAPRNASVTVKSMAVRDDNGEVLREVYTDTTFNIEIDYQVKVDGVSAGFTIVVYDSDNNCVFSSIGNHEPNWYGKMMPAGRYRTTCRVPGDFLNNGFYSISLLMFGKAFSDPAIYKDILKIEILDSPSVRGDFYGVMGGVVRPKLVWATERL